MSALGVLHPGVFVMWYAHIRDLSPTAEAVSGPHAQGNDVALGKTNEVVSYLCALVLGCVFFLKKKNFFVARKILKCSNFNSFGI